MFVLRRAIVATCFQCTLRLVVTLRYNHPMSWDILGHDAAAQILQQQAADGRQSHAYLFAGPPGVGRRTLALRFAQSLNCPNPTAPGEPCRTCRTCRQIERMQHPDLFVVRVEPGSRDIKIDQVRALEHSLSLAPYEARYRVALLLDFQQATPGAANALLKTLEEAPSKVILLLTADATENLLPTIVSRCEVLRLRPMPLADLDVALQSRAGVDTHQASLLAHLSGGRYGYALALKETPNALEQRLKRLDRVRELLSASRRERFEYAWQITDFRNKGREEADRGKEALRLELLTWLSFWRDALLCKLQAETPLVNVDRQVELSGPGRLY
ncbi:MAG: DNA polymerase III subunit delta' [Chloroflexi bacterium]|nr:DNA polymerase III subunit delta' [Chloroflexota bacterium]